MIPVEMYPVQGAVVLRQKSSELLIMPEHVEKLFKSQDREHFQQYFLHTALLNRSARKVFEAWARKDRSIWQRLEQAVKTSFSDANMIDEEPSVAEDSSVSELKQEKD